MKAIPSKRTILLAQVLLNRLERISPDSPWAHQASGVRASIARILAKKEMHQGESLPQDLENLVNLGYEILKKAAEEIPDSNSDHGLWGSHGDNSMQIAILTGFNLLPFILPYTL